jgi:hypothetical protein
MDERPLDPSLRQAADDWRADLEEIADLAAETVEPEEVLAARERRAAYSASQAFPLMGDTEGDDGEISPAVASPTPAAAADVVERGSAAPHAQAGASGEGPASVPRPHRRLALALSIGPGARRAAAAALVVALLGGVVLVADRLSPSTKLGTGRPYSSTSLAPSPATAAPASPDTVWTANPTPNSSPDAGIGSPRTSTPPTAARPSPPSPAPPPHAILPVPTSNPTSTPASTPPPTSAPTSSPAPTSAPAPTPQPTTTPSPTPSSQSFTVREARLAMGTCQSNQNGWLCSYTATFTFTPGAAGSFSWDLMGTITTCSGTTSPFDWPQPTIQVQAGTTTTTERGWVVVPGSAHPASQASGKGASSALIHVRTPDDVRSAAQPFYGAACP